MPTTEGKQKWIFDKHTRSFSTIENTVIALVSLLKGSTSLSSRYWIQQSFVDHKTLHPRNKVDMPLDTINHRIMSAKYYMFGYTVNVGAEKAHKGNERFILSPLGSLYLKYSARTDITGLPHKLSSIFLAMLFSIQFPHPADAQNPAFQLFPFRLIFKLLRDPRWGGHLYNNEVEYLLVFVKTVNQATYEKLVADILQLRLLDSSKMADLFEADDATFVKSVYEWEYYTVGILCEAGIVDYTKGPTICKLYHKQKPGTVQKSWRSATKGFISLPNYLEELCDALLASYSPFDIPLSFTDPTRTVDDVTKQIYSFYPREVLVNVGESTAEMDLADLSKAINDYSTHPSTESAYQFENVLTQGFNWFVNVKAHHFGGAGHTDIDCVFAQDGKMEKFDIDAKSTESKLGGINVGRMRQHRKEVGSKYTIIVTPCYSPAAARDIEGEPVVILLASTFSEYLMNCAFYGKENIDYTELNDLIKNNLGTDVSPLLSKLTIEKFGLQA